MNSSELKADSVPRPPKFRLSELVPERVGTSLAGDAHAGLLAEPKYLPSKYFYDALGSRLYDLICRTPEYYPARTETALLCRFASDIVRVTRPRTIVELGSGASRKTAHLFRACECMGLPVHYAPVDICKDMLVQAGSALIARHPWLSVHALRGDYTLGLGHLPALPGPNLFMFLGGTIGNFEENQAIDFLGEVRRVMRAGDWLLLGADRIKDPAVLRAAYNDHAGLTARFNLNLLRILNRELGARFDPDDFFHEARFNEELARIEMRLYARRGHRVAITDLEVDVCFDKNESILTEISRKFDRASLARLLRDAGFVLRRQYQPRNRYFSLVLASPA